MSSDISDVQKFNYLPEILGCNHLQLTIPRNARFADLILMDVSVLIGFFPEGNFFQTVAPVLKKMLAGGQLVLAIGFSKTKSSLAALAMINLRLYFTG